MGCYELVKEGGTVWDLLWDTCMDLDIAAAAVVLYNIDADTASLCEYFTRVAAPR